jgi:hypothetical protein
VGRQTVEAIRKPWESDGGYRAPKFQRGARYLASGLVLATAGVIAWGVTNGSGRLPGGDPGGRIVAQLAPVATATPKGVKVNYRNFSEPHVDYCDVTSKRGWTFADVQVNFDWTGSAQDLISLVGQKLQALGWILAPSLDKGLLAPVQSWTIRLTEGSVANATLQVMPAPASGQWNLTADAPPLGRQLCS